MTSVFSKIIAGEIPSYTLYEDEYAYAFLDINPIQQGHTLIVSKKEVDNLFDLSKEEYEGVMNATRQVAKLLQEKLGPKRIGIIVDGYLIPHAHVHVIPTNGPHELDESLQKSATVEELQAVYEKINN
jgi:histidine triad (HIT) family protein